MVGRLLEATERGSVCGDWSLTILRPISKNPQEEGIWVATLSPTLGAGGALGKGHPLLYLDVPSTTPKV